MRKWVAIGPASLLETLAPLADEHRRLGDVELVEVSSCSHVTRYVQSVSEPGTTVVIVESPFEPSARGQFRSPLVKSSNGSTVCVSCLRLDDDRLSAYAARAATLLNRPRDQPRAVVLLAPREQRYLQLLADLERVARNSDRLSLFRWSAERIRRAPLTGALKLGAAAILFSGHGTARGWYAYGGMSANTLAGEDTWSAEQSSSVMFSLSCSTGSAWRPDGLTAGLPTVGFADAVVAKGVAGAVVAPVGDPLHASNRVLARALMHAMCGSSFCVREVLEQAAMLHASLDGFVVIGDPELPVHSAAGAAERGQGIFAPAAGAVLVPRPGEWRVPPASINPRAGR
jgi:hypothetical protein